MRFFTPSALALALLLALLASSAHAGTESQAGSLQDAKAHTREEFVHGMAQMTLAILQDTKKTYADRKVVLRQAFNTVVDIDWIAKFVLGRAWVNATDEQRDHYKEQYRRFLTESYVSNFAEDPEKRIKDIKILGIQDAQEGSFIVNTNVMLANMDELKVEYRVSDHNDKWKVVDIIIENVSLLTTHRAQFAELISSNGLDGLIAKLETINAKHLDTVNMSMK